LRALNALSAVHGVPLGAGIATIHGGAFTVGSTELAMLKVEEIPGGTGVVCGADGEVD